MTGGLTWRHYGLLAALALMTMLPGLASLPPVDRDEPLFAQASKQMIESGNYADIYFQNDPRYKKPIGIYWLQSASALMFGKSPYNEIWPYRLPSLLGALAAILLTGWGAGRISGPRTGFLTAAILVSSGLLNTEARLAKTDAALLAVICGAQWILARAYITQEKLPSRLAAGFWIAQALGIMLKGPIALFISGLTILALWIADRKIDWFKQLRPLPGLALCLALTLPWLVWIGIASGGKFYAESAGHDFLGKIFTGQDRGFLPPGYYAILFPICFGPFTWLALRGLAAAWAERQNRALRFALAWILPAWIAYELIFTKLPHYVLPCYPALAWLAAHAAFQERPVAARWNLFWKAANILLGSALALFMLAVAAVPLMLGESLKPLPAGLILIAVLFLVLQMRQQLRAPAKAARWGVGSAIILIPAVFSLLLPALDSLWISRQTAEKFAEFRSCASSRLITSGYTEPSLVFLAGTATLPANGAAYAAKLLEQDSCAVAMIEKKQEAKFNGGLNAVKLGEIRGYNYNGGGWQDFSLYRPNGTKQTP
ncbi:MAG: glycosyltransferase family 39 protein [Alphaproteobacteria bacterium]